MNMKTQRFAACTYIHDVSNLVHTHNQLSICILGHGLGCYFTCQMEECVFFATKIWHIESLDKYSMSSFQDLRGQFSCVSQLVCVLHSLECKKKHKGLLYVLTSMMGAILGILIISQAFALSGMAVTISITILIGFACKF